MKDTILWKKESDEYTKRALRTHKGEVYFQKKEYQDAETIVGMLPVEKKKIKSILDIGCGFGSLTGVLAEKFPHAKVVGIDPGRESIALAKKTLKNLKNLYFAFGYSHVLGLQEQFDLVVLRMVF